MNNQNGKTCACPSGYADGDEGACVKVKPVKVKTVGNRDCRNDSVCGPNEGKDFHWCYTEDVSGDVNATLPGEGWDYCCADGVCGMENDGDEKDSRCWVDEARTNVRSCRKDKR